MAPCRSFGNCTWPHLVQATKKLRIDQAARIRTKKKATQPNQGYQIPHTPTSSMASPYWMLWPIPPDTPPISHNTHAQSRKLSCPLKRSQPAYSFYSPSLDKSIDPPSPMLGISKRIINQFVAKFGRLSETPLPYQTNRTQWPPE